MQQALPVTCNAAAGENFSGGPLHFESNHLALGDLGAEDCSYPALANVAAAAMNFLVAYLFPQYCNFDGKIDAVPGEAPFPIAPQRLFGRALKGGTHTPA